MCRLVRSLCFFLVLAGGFFRLTPASAATGLLTSYTADVVISDPLGYNSMTIAFDGTYYWTSTGGSTNGLRYAQITAGGALVQTYSPGLDFRSVFVNPGSPGTVYARQYDNGTLYQQTSPGVFSATTVSLSGLDPQASVVFNGTGTGYLAMNNGVVSNYSLSGALLGTVSLSGWGTGAESSYPQNRGIAASGSYWFTYDSGTLSIWNTSGTRIGTTTLIGAGTGFDANFSLSVTNGMVFIADGPGGSWRGYKIGDFSAIPEPETWALFAVGGAACVVLRWRRRGA